MRDPLHGYAFPRKGGIAGELDNRHSRLEIEAGRVGFPSLAGCPPFEKGTIRVSRLVLLELLVPWENLFLTVPHGWVSDRDLIRQAANLVEALPHPYRDLFNTIFWNGGRFGRFCTMPPTICGHPAGGNRTCAMRLR